MLQWRKLYLRSVEAASRLTRTSVDMPNTEPTATDLQSFLERQPKGTLVAVLLELARDHAGVQARLERLQLAGQPGRLAAEFRKTLVAWKRSRRFLDYREAGAFGRTLETWLEQVERELLPDDPAAALALFQDVVKADRAWFDRADDSDGAIGNAVRTACRHWLRAAARCEPPRAGWPDRLLALYDADEHGAREELLRAANLLLDEPAQRALVSRLDTALVAMIGTGATPGSPPLEIFRISAALSLLAESLRDPDVAVRATLRYSPDPNPLQRQSFVRDYLDADRPADALVWLQGDWGPHEAHRLALLAEALERLGRFDESVPIRKAGFERTLSVFDLQRWLEHVPDAARSAAQASARELALGHPDRVAAAHAMLALGDPAEAEARLLVEPEHIDGNRYTTVLALAEALQGHGCLRGETVLYRALLGSILDRAYARAYGHAARYWSRLSEIASAGTDLHPLTLHAEFEATIRARHGRKSSFWALVNGTRREGRRDGAPDS